MSKVQLPVARSPPVGLARRVVRVGGFGCSPDFSQLRHAAPESPTEALAPENLIAAPKCLFWCWHTISTLCHDKEKETYGDPDLLCAALGETKIHSALFARHRWQGLLLGPVHLSFCLLHRKHAEAAL